MMETVKVDKDGWIDYQEKILIVEMTEDGLRPFSGWFQYDGVSCRQACVEGSLAECFQSKSKWFSPDWWYKKTCWGTKYPQKIFFETAESLEKAPIHNFNIFEIRDEKEIDQIFKENDEYVDERSRPSSDILKAILKEVHDKTGKNYSLDFEDDEYGKHWWESRIPLKLGDKKYILTWMNCD